MPSSFENDPRALQAGGPKKGLEGVLGKHDPVAAG